MKCGCNYSQPASFASSSQVPLPRQSVAPKNTQKSVSILSILLLLGFFGILAFAGFQIYSLLHSNTNYNRSSNSPDNTSSQQSEAQNHSIVSQAFSLKATEYSSYKFTIPKNSGGGTVTGNFTASGGSNDIYVLITNESGLTNIKSGNNYKAFYSSGKVTTDNINVNLSPGTYYLVFSNIYSVMTPKAVNADVSVTY